jgi:hypothetical protein
MSTILDKAVLKEIQVHWNQNILMRDADFYWETTAIAAGISP